MSVALGLGSSSWGVDHPSHPLLMTPSSAHADRVVLALLVLPASPGPVVLLALKVQLVLWARKVRR